MSTVIALMEIIASRKWWILSYTGGRVATFTLRVHCARSEWNHLRMATDQSWARAGGPRYGPMRRCVKMEKHKQRKIIRFKSTNNSDDLSECFPYAIIMNFRCSASFSFSFQWMKLASIVESLMSERFRCAHILRSFISQKAYAE